MLLFCCLIAAGKQTPQTVLLCFSAEYCGPCKKTEPIIQQLIDEGYPIQKVDIQKEKKLARKHKVKQIPCFVMIVNGKETGRIVGLASLKQLKQLIGKSWKESFAISIFSFVLFVFLLILFGFFIIVTIFLAIDWKIMKKQEIAYCLGLLVVMLTWIICFLTL